MLGTLATGLTALAVLTLALAALAASRLSTLAGTLAAAAGLLAGAVVTTGAWVTVLAGHCWYYFLLMCICICIRLLHFSFFGETSYEEYSNWPRWYSGYLYSDKSKSQKSEIDWNSNWISTTFFYTFFFKRSDEVDLLQERTCFLLSYTTCWTNAMTVNVSPPPSFPYVSLSAITAQTVHVIKKRGGEDSRKSSSKTRDEKERKRNLRQICCNYNKQYEQ